MKHVVITGSTRAIGSGLARALLDLGCSEKISGRQDVETQTQSSQRGAASAT